MSFFVKKNDMDIKDLEAVLKEINKEEQFKNQQKKTD